ncbi:MAG: sugar ABC transporter substrate-binding protein [Thermincolia bacterium]
MRRTWFKRIAVALLIGIMMMTLAGCPGGGEKKPQLGGGEEKPKMSVGVSVATAEGDDYKFIKKTMEEQKKQEKVEVMWKDAKNDPMEQAVNVDEMVKKKVKAIIIQPVDPAQGAGLVRKMMEEKIKVVALERLPLNTPLDAFVTPDYRRAGELQGEFILDRVPAGKIVVFSSHPNLASSLQMMEGFQSKVQQNPQLQVVEVKLPEGADAVSAKELVVTTLPNHPSAKAIVAQDAALTKALVETMGKMPPSKPLVTVGIGAGEEATKALAEGTHAAEVDIRPDLLGQYSLKAALQLANKEPLDYDEKIRNDDSDVPVKVIPVRLIKRENVFMLAERWGKVAEGGGGKDKGGKKEEKKGQESQSSEGSSEGSSEEGSESGSENGGQGKEGQQGQGKITKLKVTTKDGKTMEIDIPGEIAKIEAQAGDEQGGQQQGGSEGGGQ